MSLLSRFSIRAKITVLMALLAVATGGLYTILLVKVRKAAFIAEVDARLLTAARCTQIAVGSDYHGSITDTNSVSPATYDAMVARNNRVCLDLDLSYLWSVLVLDTNTVVFTSATSPSKEVSKQDHAAFFSVHSDPAAYATAISTMSSTSSTFRNEWGSGRMVLIPGHDTRGRVYMVGASVLLGGFRAAVRQTVMQSVHVGMAILLVAFLVGVLLSRYLSSPIIALTAASERMAAGDDSHVVPSGGSREIATLSRSFETMRDAIRRQMVELRVSEQNVTTTLNSIGDAVIATDDRGLVTRMNRIAENLTGWPREQAVGQPLNTIFRIINADTRRPVPSPVERVLARGEVIALANHTVLLSRDGKERQIADSGAPIRDANGRITGVVLVFRDVTEEYALRSQLEHAQRMEAIGRLAGGVAHDFNNLLMAIQTNAMLLADDLSDNPEAREQLSEIDDAATRGADLTRQLLGFARKGNLRMAPIDIHDSIHEVTKLLRRSIDPRIEVCHELTAPGAVIEGDSSQWHNALLNLAVNAADAMDGGGVLTFKTDLQDMRETDLSRYMPKLQPGKYLRVSVCDTGVGMDDDTRRQMFEPFFTTKPLGKGTGLGLAGVFGTVQSHDGAIDVSSSPGEGTTVRILLPPTQVAADTDSARPAPLPLGDADAGKRGHILIVDDEPSVLRAVTRALERIGFTTTTCSDGQLALEWYREHCDETDLVLLDERMPKLSGTQTFLKLRELDPEVKVIVMSGFTDEGVINNLLSRGVLDFIEKPCQLADLSSKVSRHINVPRT
jgi:PAS domain S-box-containing protein